jgi:hypothetical protein
VAVSELSTELGILPKLGLDGGLDGGGGRWSGAAVSRDPADAGDHFLSAKALLLPLEKRRRKRKCTPAPDGSPLVFERREVSLDETWRVEEPCSPARLAERPPSRILDFRSTRPHSFLGESSAAVPPSSSAASVEVSSMLPSPCTKSSHAACCCAMEEWISREITKGMGDVAKAVSRIARITATSSSFVQSVLPCVTTGMFCGPSQRSISMERQPASKRRRYISAVDVDASWLPVRYELCDDATQ